MKKNRINMDQLFAKRAKLFDEQAVRAEVRRVRALSLGNQREADGAVRTIAEAQESARMLRVKIGQSPVLAKPAGRRSERLISF